MTLKEQALFLYKTVFSDDPEDFAKDFIDRFFETSCRYMLRDGKIVSMLFLLDCSVYYGGKSHPALYLYAAATLPEMRGQGIMSRLIEEAENEAFAEGRILLTKPATESLFGYYARFGFKTCAFTSEKTVIAEKNSAECGKKLSLDEYLSLRRQLLSDRPHLTLSCIDFAYDRLQLFGDDGFFAAVDTEENPPVVAEYFALDPSAEQRLLCSLGVSSLLITTEGDRDFAMLASPPDLTVPEKLFFGTAMS